MKKVLFATTALVASTGFASAQGVALSGSAEMGVVGGDRYGGDLEFHTSVDVRFRLTGETDNGLTFGATVDLDDAVESAIRGNDLADTGSSELADFSVFLSGNFGTITMGDTDGALDWAMEDLDKIADINDSNTSHLGFNGNGGLDGMYDGQVARYDYSFGDFAFAVSAEIDDAGVGDPTFGIGGKYNGDLGGVNLGVGLGYQDNGVTSAVGVSLSATFSNITAVVNYTDFDGMVGCAAPLNDPGIVCIPAAIESHAAIGLFYTMDALSVGVNYGQHDIGTFAGIADYTGFGLAANYDLGGGASLRAGYSQSSAQDFFGALGDTVTSDTFSLGIAMSF